MTFQGVIKNCYKRLTQFDVLFVGHFYGDSSDVVGPCSTKVDKKDDKHANGEHESAAENDEMIEKNEVNVSETSWRNGVG